MLERNHLAYPTHPASWLRNNWMVPYETWWKLSPHELIIFTKFHEDRTKIVDFLLMANFWKCPVFLLQTLDCSLVHENERIPGNAHEAFRWKIAKNYNFTLFSRHFVCYNKFFRLKCVSSHINGIIMVVDLSNGL